VSLQEQRSKQTKQAILLAAEELFSKNGYETVTIRQIAKRAECSHTTIYIYFKDKEHLLQELAVPVLTELETNLTEILQNDNQDAVTRLESFCTSYVKFAFQQRGMYQILITVASERIDQPKPTTPLNRLRKRIFELLQKGLADCIQSEGRTAALDDARCLFYMLHGFIITYLYSEEETDRLWARLQPVL
jgi:AcrR family transcriptional regulator